MINLGCVIGDICGSVYEFKEVTTPHTDLNLFEYGSQFTDDTVMNCAVANWLLNDKKHTTKGLCNTFKKYGKIYPDVGYGWMFAKWLQSDDNSDYGSYGNGSGMRVSPVGFYAESLDECLELAEITAKTTHGHEEGIKGAKAIASAIFLARRGVSKTPIKRFLTEQFGYQLDEDWTELGWKKHRFDASCQITVPEALSCFLQSDDFEDCIRKSIALGGDTDTIACMAGGIAEAYYGVPAYLQEKAKAKLDSRLRDDLMDFTNYCDAKILKL